MARVGLTRNSEWLLFTCARWNGEGEAIDLVRRHSRRRAQNRRACEDKQARLRNFSKKFGKQAVNDREQCRRTSSAKAKSSPLKWMVAFWRLPSDEPKTVTRPPTVGRLFGDMLFRIGAAQHRRTHVRCAPQISAEKQRQQSDCAGRVGAHDRRRR